MNTIILLGGSVFLVLQLIIRFLPMRVKKWHIDPFSASNPQRSGVLIKLCLPFEPKDSICRLCEIAESSPCSKRIAGDIESGRVTYVVRSVFWGFPDVVTIAVRSSEQGSELAVLSRLRFGRFDFYVNERRVKAWLEAAGLDEQEICD